MRTLLLPTEGIQYVYIHFQSSSVINRDGFLVHVVTDPLLFILYEIYIYILFGDISRVLHL